LIKIETKHGVVELRSDEILCFRPDVKTFKEYNLEVLKDLLKIFIEITDGKPRPYLADNSYITGIVNKEEQDYMNQHFCKFATKAAIITHSPVMKIIHNTYNLLFKPEIEIQLFTHEDKAINWLLE